MCQTPILIANRSRRFTDGVSQRHFKVACGHCYECRKRMQDDWFVRSFFEFQRVRKTGSAWFFTLTYDQQNLPFWIDKNYIDPVDASKFFVRPCFNPLDLKRFRDRLRVYLSRAGFSIKDIRIFITCELGGEFGRPHYHPLLFLPYRIPFKTLWDIINKAWKKGRVGFSAKHGMLVRSEKAVSYCCKYVSKESFWWRRFRLDEYHAHLVTNAHNDFAGADELLKTFRRYYRTHFQSMRYGLTGVDCVTEKMLVDDRINLLDFGLSPDVTLKNSEFAVPHYYKNKLMKDVDEYNTQRDSKLALSVKELKFNQLVTTIADALRVYFDYNAFRDHFSPLQLSDGLLHDYFNRISDLLSDCALPPTPRVIAIYSLCYQDLNFALYNPDVWPIQFLGVTSVALRYSMSPEDCRSLLLSHACDFYSKKSLYEREIPDEQGKSRFDKDKKFFSAQLPSFGDLPCFKGFDNFLAEISLLEFALGTKLSQSKVAVDDEQYNTALITGVLDNKYCYIFNPVFKVDKL